MLRSRERLLVTTIGFAEPSCSKSTEHVHQLSTNFSSKQPSIRAKATFALGSKQTSAATPNLRCANNLCRQHSCQPHLQPSDVAVEVLRSWPTKGLDELAVACVQRVDVLDVVAARRDARARLAAHHEVLKATRRREILVPALQGSRGGSNCINLHPQKTERLSKRGGKCVTNLANLNRRDALKLAAASSGVAALSSTFAKLPGIQKFHHSNG